MEGEVQFSDFGLDDRILKAIYKLRWQYPTLVQSRAIPLALEGKDVLAKAQTGSGKTAAYIIPVIQKVLITKQTSNVQNVTVLVLAPSKELCKQIYKNFLEIAFCCTRDVKCVDISDLVSVNVQKPLLADNPDVVIGTPSRVLAHIKSKNLVLKNSLKMLVIDEADLMFAFGFEKDTKDVLRHLPSIYQSVLMSATLSEDLTLLKKLVLHNPVILKLEEPELPNVAQLTHYHIKCEENDKFVILYTLLKLRLVRGRSIIFVSNVDRCFKIKLYLEQFGIPSCVLNSELPERSRSHVISQFNEGKYDIIVGSDENNFKDSAPDTASTQPNGSKRKRDLEYGISRGIDFKSVANIINFDFPSCVKSYIHRVGRTARGYNKGTALSFVSIKDMNVMKEVEEYFSGKLGPSNVSIFKPYNFKMEEIEAFRYRAQDAMRVVTSIAIREARLKEIKRELLTSVKLKAYFKENPKDFAVLRHDKPSHTIKIHSHLKDVPDYIVPPALQSVMGIGNSSKSSKRQKRKKDQKYRKKPLITKKFSKEQLKLEKMKMDPLKSFQFSGFKK